VPAIGLRLWPTLRLSRCANHQLAPLADPPAVPSSQPPTFAGCQPSSFAFQMASDLRRLPTFRLCPRTQPPTLIGCCALRHRLPANLGLASSTNPPATVRSNRRLAPPTRPSEPVLRPPAPPGASLQLSLAPLPLAAPAQNLRLASAACTPARPVANLRARIGFASSARSAANLRCAPAVPRFRSTGGDPSGLRLTILVSSGSRPTIPVPSSLRRMALPPARPTTYLRFTSDAVLWLRWRPHMACAACCPCSPGGLRLRIAPAAITLRLHRPGTLRLAPSGSFSG